MFSNCNCVLATIIVLATGCDFAALESASDRALQGPLAADRVFAMMQSTGLSCGAQEAILSLSEHEARHLHELIRGNMSPEEVGQMASDRDVGCAYAKRAQETNPTGEIGETTQAVTTNYTVRFVPANYNSFAGVYASYILRDSSTYGWMCNNGSSEYPADYIAQYHVSGAYSHADNLKVYGTNQQGICYLQPTNASRIYSDDDVRMCIGYFHWYVCSSWTPQTTETKMYWQ